MLSARAGIVTEWVLLGLSFIFVGLRLYVRWWLQGQISLSDLFVILAVVFTLYSTTVNTIVFTWGFWGGSLAIGGNPYESLHISPEMPPLIRHRVIVNFKMTLASVLCYFSSIWCIKANFLLFYYKLFPTDPLEPRRARILRYVLHFTAVLTGVGYALIVLLNTLSCMPFVRNWTLDPSLCLAYGQTVAVWFTFALHISSDVLIYTLPFFLLPYLGTFSLRRRISLSLVFALGSLCIATALGRIIALATAAPTQVLGLWCAAEQASATIVACCPPLKWLYHSVKYWPSVNGSMDGSTAPPNASRIASRIGSEGRAGHRPSTGAGGFSVHSRDEWGTFMYNRRAMRNVFGIADEEGVSDDDVIERIPSRRRSDHDSGNARGRQDGKSSIHRHSGRQQDEEWIRMEEQASSRPTTDESAPSAVEAVVPQGHGE